MTNLNPTLNNPDVILHIGSFMKPSDAVSLTQVNKVVRAKSEALLKNKYQETFGEINQQPDKKITARLLRCGEKQPDTVINHNIYKAPSDRLERWKWLSGVENNLDQEVQENYISNISLLENSKATSIIQLKNQMQGFWHSDRQIKDYEKFRSDEKARATSGLINKIFFACLWVLFKLYYNSSVVVNIGKILETRSCKTFAKIGGFNLNHKDYVVVAFHVLADEQSKDQYQDDYHREFKSLSLGRTHIGIFESHQTYSLSSLGHYGSNQNFSVLIGREEANNIGIMDELSSEECYRNGEVAVLNSKRHLIIGNELEYRDGTEDVHGADRLLDQKLTQIMIEMTMQNKEIISLEVDSTRDDLPVLTAGGFKSRIHNRKLQKEIMEDLSTFRSKEENKLFPPSRDYGRVLTSFNTQDLGNQNVHYSKGSPESWYDIIQRNPILKPESAILPEYWVEKPKIIEG